MTKGPRLQLAALFAATIALGLPWGWTHDSEGDRVPMEISSSVETGLSVAPSDEAALEGRVFEEREVVFEEAAASEPQRPHPITKAHEAMSQRREVLGAAVAAIQKKEYESARRWLAEADELEESPGSGGTQEVRGYKLILECLDARKEKSELPNSLLEASKEYVEQQRLPPRREVRRVCLEGRPFARRA